MGLNEETIDIPESGAVFTLGKSHLSENHQSYFFIKNDAIRRLICGRNQSAVVCESGRLFVWGENPYGQLGIGANEIVTKPSCVKTIKALGQRVRNVAFGEAFAVILTESSQLYYSGRSEFDASVTPQFRERFWNLGNDLLVSRKPFELVDFVRTIHDDEGNSGEHFVDVAAGDEHFVVLTGSGRLYGWGSNRRGQLGNNTKPQDKPILVSGEENVRVVSCGRFCTAFISANNEIFILGQLGGLVFVELTQINTTSFEDLMYSMYLAHDDQIYLVINSGEIFRSEEREGDLSFAPHNVINENIRKICTGDGYVSIVTESNKLLTTFRERTSASSNSATNDRIRSPRELRKFNRLDVLDAVSGQNHILVHAVQPSSNGQLILSSSSNDEDSTLKSTSTMNDLNRTYSKATAQNNADDDESESLLKTLRRCLTMKDNPNILASKIPVFDSSRISQERKSHKSAHKNSGVDQMNEINNNLQNTNVSGHIDEENAKETSRNGSIEKSLSLNEFEKLEREQASVDDDEIKETNEIPITDLPNSAGSQKSNAQTVFHITPSNQYTIPDGEIVRLMNDSSATENNDEVNNVDFLKFENKPMLEDETISLQTLDNDINFIDNGVNMTKGSSISNEINDSADVGFPLASNEGHMEDDLLGETISSEIISNPLNIKEETKQAVRIAVDEISNKSSPAASDPPRKKTPMPRNRTSDDPTDLDDGERTTASITSISSGGNRNPFDEDDLDKGHPKDTKIEDGLVSVESGRMKRFIREMRTKGKGISCRNADTVAEDQIQEATTTTTNPFEETATNDRTSKVCTIL